jgi:hypothetical protein
MVFFFLLSPLQFFRPARLSKIGLARAVLARLDTFLTQLGSFWLGGACSRLPTLSLMALQTFVCSWTSSCFRGCVSIDVLGRRISLIRRGTVSLIRLQCFFSFSILCRPLFCFPLGRCHHHFCLRTNTGHSSLWLSLCFIFGHRRSLLVSAWLLCCVSFGGRPCLSSSFLLSHY